MEHSDTGKSSERTIGSSSSSSSSGSNSRNRDDNTEFPPLSTIRGTRGRGQHPLPATGASFTPLLNESLVSSPPDMALRFSRGSFASIVESAYVRDTRPVQSLASFSSPMSSSTKNRATPSRSSALYNLPAAGTTEEDVLVMDGILLTPPGSSRARPSAPELGSLAVKSRRSSKTESRRGNEDKRSSRQAKSKGESSWQSKNSDDVRKGAGSEAPMKSEENELMKLLEEIESGKAPKSIVERLDPEQIALSTDPLVERLAQLCLPSRRRRLPAFEVFCPEEEEDRGQ